MPAFTEEQIRAAEESRRDREEARLSYVRKVVDFVRMWECCENRACRRERGCSDPRACLETYEEEIIRWTRQVTLPWLRKRYPTVQWGAPASVVEPQLEAAFAAEKEEEARRQGRPVQPAAGSRGKKQRVKRQPLYDPGDV